MRLLHMLISKITISKTREIESILNINDNLIIYLSNGGEPSPEVLSADFGELSKVDSFIEKMNGWKVVKSDLFTFDKSEITKSKEKRIVILNFNK